MRFMKISFVRFLMALGGAALAPLSFALDSVNPTGVNINRTDTTTVFLSFRGTAGQVSDQAFWCGEITVPANTVTTTNPCVAGTLFGRLPERLDQARPGADTLTDIMTIPPSVARRAVQAARDGVDSSFFYVRRFVSSAGVQYIAVTCRLAGGGARVPLAITNVQPYFEDAQGKVGVYLLAQDESAPPVGAVIKYNGSGRLKGRWEIVRPGDVLPEPFDLLPEASLPIEQRGLQKRYQVLDTFDVFLQPSGEAVIPGPAAGQLPNIGLGPYQVLLRVEATFDREGNSDPGLGFVASGGAAGFALPSLRYYVATEDQVLEARSAAGTLKKLRLLNATSVGPESGSSLQFSWLDMAGVSFYRFELELDGAEPFAAILDQYTPFYRLPAWVLETAPASSGKWRVSAYGQGGQRLGRSSWRSVTIER